MSGDPPAVLKSLAVDGLGQIPVFGWLLSFTAECLIPDSNNENAVVDELKAYVNDMMQEVLDETKVEIVKTAYLRLHGELSGIKNAHSPKDKANVITAIYNESNAAKDVFSHYSDEPWNTLAYLTPFATIRLQALQERVLHYHDLYKSDDRDPASTLKELTDEIALMQSWTDTARQKAIAWRVYNNLSIQHTPEGPVQVGEGPVAGGSPAYPESWTVTDKRDSKFQATFTDAAQADKYLANRYWDLLTEAGGYVDKIHTLTNASRYWVYLNPDSIYKPVNGPYYWYARRGDAMRYGTEFNHQAYYKAHGEISRFDFYWDDGALKGIQVWYGGVDSGLVGVKSNQGGTYNMSDNKIVSVGGHSGDYVDRFYYNTSDRVQQGLGPMGHSPVAGADWGVWSPDPNAHVAYFAGTVSPTGVISQLRMAWVNPTDYTLDLGREHGDDPYGIDGGVPYFGTDLLINPSQGRIDTKSAEKALADAIAASRKPNASPFPHGLGDGPSLGKSPFGATDQGGFT